MSEEHASRRQSKRFKVNWGTRLLFPNKRIFPARTKDISLGGLGFDFDMQLPVGQELNIELSPWITGKQYIIRAKGVVTYNMIKGGDAGFSYGLKFTMIPKDQLEQLKEVIKILEQGV